MASKKRMDRLRDAGITATMQRIAVLEFLEETSTHPTADEVYAAIHDRYPTIARATVYNTLDALTQAGAILKLTVDPNAARYDADLRPHIHFRCRLCGKVYDIAMEREKRVGEIVMGHHVESVRTYAYGVCAACQAAIDSSSPSNGAPAGDLEKGKKPKAFSTDSLDKDPSARTQKTQDVSSVGESPTGIREVHGRKKPKTSSTYSSDKAPSSRTQKTQDVSSVGESPTGIREVHGRKKPKTSSTYSSDKAPSSRTQKTQDVSSVGESPTGIREAHGRKKPKASSTYSSSKGKEE